LNWLYRTVTLSPGDFAPLISVSDSCFARHEDHLRRRIEQHALKSCSRLLSFEAQLTSRAKHEEWPEAIDSGWESERNRLRLTPRHFDCFGSFGVDPDSPL
jgi:hypothetical protein